MSDKSWLTRRSNHALEANPNVFNYPRMSDINITTHGSDVYWAVCAVMTVSTFAFIGLSFKIPRSKRIFHYITAAITMVAAIAYFTMASNLGYAAIPVEFIRSNPKVAGFYREIFYVRYIDWVITTPLLLLDVMLTAGLPWPTILYTLLIDEIMIVTGLVGALVASAYKWGYFVFAMFALFFVAYNLLIVGRTHANHISREVGRTYLLCGGWTMFLWFLYPIAWGVSEGGNVISPDSEAVFYSVLDVLAKPGFGALLLWGHRNIDPAVLGLHIRDYDDPVGANAINQKNEKSGHANHALSGGPVNGNSENIAMNNYSTGAEYPTTTGATHGDATMPATTGVHNNTTSAV